MDGDERRKIIAQKLFDLANIDAGVIVFSEVAGRGQVRSGLVIIGFAIFIFLYGLGYFLLAKK